MDLVIKKRAKNAHEKASFLDEKGRNQAISFEFLFYEMGTSPALKDLTADLRGRRRRHGPSAQEEGRYFLRRV